MRPASHYSATVAILLVSIACTGSQTVERTSSTNTAATTTTVAPTTTAAPTTTMAPDAAPTELHGSWVTDLGQGETLRLSLRGTSYTAQVVGTPDSGNGKISVEGDTIKFSDSDRCPDDPGGTYTWNIEDGILTFTLIGEDPCGRTGFLVGHAFTFFSP